MALIQWKQINASSVTWATPDRNNKNMAASLTTADGNLACASVVAQTPAASTANGGYVGVRVNGVHYLVADNDTVRTTSDCYFSGNGGTTARAMGTIVTGDLLYWNGSVAGFQLATTDRIDFIYDTIS